LSATWLKLFGYSVFNAHLFALSVSVIFLLVFYFFGKSFFGEKVALASLAILSVQAVFLAQSAMLLPDILLSLLSILVIWTYLEKRTVLFNLFAILLLLTKETGVVVLFTISIFDINEGYRNKLTFKQLIIHSIGLFTIPICVVVAFFLLQKHIFGWFLFPDHLSMMASSISAFFNELKGYFLFVFIFYSRNLLTLLLLVSSGIILYRNIPIKKEILVLSLLSLFVFCYILFMSINFYTARYMLSIIPFFILICVYFIYKATENIK
jgi:hypothetical protein